MFWWWITIIIIWENIIARAVFFVRDSNNIWLWKLNFDEQSFFLHHLRIWVGINLTRFPIYISARDLGLYCANSPRRTDINPGSRQRSFFQLAPVVPRVVLYFRVFLYFIFRFLSTNIFTYNRGVKWLAHYLDLSRIMRACGVGVTKSYVR